MSSQEQQTFACPDLLSPNDFGFRRSLNSATQMADRAFIGIPAEDVEYSRASFSHMDPSTKERSVPSASQESDQFDDAHSYDASRSGIANVACRVFTPPSGSDAPLRLQPQIMLNGSYASSTGGAGSLHTPSASGSTSLGTNREIGSSIELQTQQEAPASRNRTPELLSPSSEAMGSRPFDPLEGMSDPREIIELDQADIDFLQELQLVQRDGQLESSPRALDPPHLPDNGPYMSAFGSSSTVAANTSGVKRPAAERPHLIPIRTPKSSSGSRATKKERAALTSSGREMAHKLREIGVCLRCLVNHEPCGLGDECARCQKAMKAAKVWRMPCFRIRLSDAELHRKGALNFPDGPRKIETWTSRNNRTISLYNIGPAHPDQLPESRPCLKVICRPYNALEGECYSKSWIKGIDRVDIHLPTFAIPAPKLGETAQNLQMLVEANFGMLVAELGAGQDEIVSCTLEEAARQANKCSTLKAALKISIISRLASKSFNIFGSETLGIERQQDPDSPYYNRIPIPPFLDAQIDFIWIEKMAVLKKQVLSELRGMITNKGRNRWFMIYLTTLVLLFNLEFVYEAQVRQGDRYREINYRQRTMMEALEYGAKNLNAHFHAICRGNIPLNMDWNEEVQKAAEVDDESLEFLRRLKSIVQSRVAELSALAKSTPGTPLVWISALFLPHEEG